MYNSTYITKNRLGIYYFQYSYTEHEIGQFGSSLKRKLIRKSLKTRIKRDALFHAKHLWLLMNKIHKKYFQNPELFAIAMKLVAQYEFVEEKGWQEVDDFFAELDDDDSKLLELGLKQKNQDRIDLIASSSNTRKIISSNIDKKSPHLSELIKKWLSEKERNVKASTMASYKNQINLFGDVIKELNKEDIRLQNLTTELVREFNAILNQIPAKRNAKIYAGKNFAELAQMNVTKITSKTYHYYINTVIEFLTWCEAQGYIENTRFKTILQSSKKNIPKRGKFQKVNFDKNDLKKIFESKQYISGSFKKATDYWVPLLALFTGARLGEICQLKVTDIKKSDGIYCIDINEDDEDKSIKTKVSSVRLIPIHQELFNLGLIEYVDELKKLKKKNLFEINYGIIRGQYHSTQKQMSAYLKKVGITSTANKSKSFHSFRHTVRTRLAELDIEERTIDAIIGHASEARSIGSKMYTHTKLIKQKQSAIKKLTYDIDFTKMKKWKDCKFAVL